jgi:hypothetical protein
MKRLTGKFRQIAPNALNHLGLGEMNTSFSTTRELKRKAKRMEKKLKQRKANEN